MQYLASISILAMIRHASASEVVNAPESQDAGCSEGKSLLALQQRTSTDIAQRIGTARPVASSDHANCSFIDERGAFGHKEVCFTEAPEHELVRHHLPSNATVLELGGRYGTTSCEIAFKQSNSGRLVVVEPDLVAKIPFKKNIASHACEAKLFNGVVGNSKTRMTGGSYATRVQSLLETDIIIGKSFEEVEAMFGMNFDALLIDCEGCVETFLDENPLALNGINTILLEGDMGCYGDDCDPAYSRAFCGTGCVDYNKVLERFQRHGFEIVDTFQEGHGSPTHAAYWFPWIHHFALKRNVAR